MTYIEIMGRGAGKTYRMVQWVLAGEDRIIVVANRQRYDYMLHSYESSGLQPRHLMLPREFTSGTYRGRTERPLIALDEAIDVLQEIAIGATLARVSFSRTETMYGQFDELDLPPDYLPLNEKET